MKLKTASAGLFEMQLQYMATINKEKEIISMQC